MVSDPEELRSLLRRHVISPVKWEPSVRALADAGATSFLEAGPGDVLTKLMKRIVPDAAARAIGSPEDARAAASGTAHL
ncbi:MAG: ACP S-malonyltransferase [Actinobacteria bacterium]|nr:ACP S-malonyltransferase [Actinomycetota bacterium]